MDSIKLWARNGEAVREAIELGELIHLETASEEITDEFLLFAIASGLSKKWAEAFPAPRNEPEIGHCQLNAKLSRIGKILDSLLSQNGVFGDVKGREIFFDRRIIH